MPHVTFIGNDEQRLVEQLQEGNTIAAREFYTRYVDRLAGVCMRYIADEEKLKDVLQNTFSHIFYHIAEFEYRGPGSLLAWSRKVVVNESLKFLKAEKHFERLQENDDIAEENADDTFSVSNIPSDIIQQMMSRLPTGYRTVLNLYVIEGLSHQEISRLLGIKESTSASQLHKAKRMLAKMIKKYNDENPNDNG